MSNNRNDDPRRLAEIFKALSNPHRLNILLRLVRCYSTGTSCMTGAEVPAGACACVGELGRDLGIAPSTVSHHIKELYHAGLIRMEKQGQKVQCQVDLEVLRDLAGFFAGLTSAGPLQGEDDSASEDK